MIAPATVEEFLDFVKKSELLDTRQFVPYIERLRKASSLPGSPNQLAQALIRDGFLTYYQAEQILAGRYKSFFISGKYKVLERLGSGGMASVYLCEHRVMKRLVALKVLPGVRADDPDTLARFHREARAIGQLRHPNIVGAHDIDQHGKLHFLVMEYVDGCNLEEFVQAHGPLGHLQAAHYIRQAAEGLQHAHEAGMVHRDLKPANLLLDHAGTVKLLDLGLARFFGDETDGLTKRADRQLVLGTLDYLAPEQVVDSHEADIRADIYGLGATFSYLLTGKGLFPDLSAMDKLAAHRNAQDRSIRERCPTVPKGLAAIIDKMLRRNPAQRFQTPKELADALATWTREPPPPPDLDGLTRLSPAARSTVQKQTSFKIAVPSSASSATREAPQGSGTPSRTLSKVSAIMAPATSPMGRLARDRRVWLGAVVAAAFSVGILATIAATRWWPPARASAPPASSPAPTPPPVPSPAPVPR